MKVHKKSLIPASLSAVFILYGCMASPYRQAYDEAVKAERYDEAYRGVREVCEKNPNDSLCAELDAARARYANQRYAKLKAVIEVKKRPIPLADLNSIKSEISAIKEINPFMPMDWAIGAMADETKKTEAVVKTAVKDAGGYIKKNERKRAVERLRYAYSLDQSIEKELKEYSDKAREEAYAEGKRKAVAGEWKAARKAFEDVFYIDPAFADVKTLMDDARVKDSYQYHYAWTQKALEDGNFEEALRLSKIVISYEDKDEAQELLTSVRVKHSNALFARGAELYKNGSPLSAGVSFSMAVSGIKGVSAYRTKDVVIPSDDISRLLDELFVKGKEELAGGRKELAYVYFMLIASIQPDYPEIMTVKEGVKEEIAKKALNSFAVIPFKGPAHNEDGGKIMTSMILHFLYKEMSNDIRILERSAMEALVKESEVKALQGAGEKTSPQLIDADYLLVGDVVDFKVDSSTAESFKTVRTKTDIRKVLNPEHERWETKGGIGDEPAKYVEEPVYENVKYKISRHKKTAAISIGYRVVNTKGDVVHSGIVEKRLDKEDDASEGVEIGDLKIPEKTAKLPPDAEMLKAVENDVIDEMGKDIQGLFSKPEERLVKEGGELAEKGNFNEAVERLVKAFFIYVKKGLDAAPIEKRIYAVVEQAKM